MNLRETKVMSAATAYMITDMLVDTAENGLRSVQ